MDDWYFDDDFINEDYNWIDKEAELREELRGDDQQKKSVNDISYIAFRRLNDKEKLIYLYNKIRDLYSYLLTIQDVV